MKGRIRKYIAILLAVSLVCSLFIMPVFAVEDTTKTEILIEKTFANNKFSFKKIDIQDAKVVSIEESENSTEIDKSYNIKLEKGNTDSVVVQLIFDATNTSSENVNQGSGFPVITTDKAEFDKLVTTNIQAFAKSDKNLRALTVELKNGSATASIYYHVAPTLAVKGSVTLNFSEEENAEQNTKTIEINKTFKEKFKFSSIEINNAGILNVQKVSNDANVDEVYNIKLSSKVGDNAAIQLKFNATNISSENANQGNGFPVITTDKAEFDKLATTNIQAFAKSDKNLRALTVELKNGSATVPIYYHVAPTLNVKGSVTLNFYKAGQKPNIVKCELEKGNGQWMFESDIYADSKRDGAIVTPYGKEEIQLKIHAKNCTAVSLNGQIQTFSESGTYLLHLNTSIDGSKNIITLKNEDGQEAVYTVTCYQQKLTGLPNAVTDYICVNSQFTNGGAPALGAYGVTEKAVATLRGEMGVGLTYPRYPEASLGNYGGYITYYYENAITDNPNNPYGIDFIVYGNSSSPNEDFAEPGNILVSEDGENWYTLAGSLHYDDTAVWDYKITYEPAGNGCTWKDNFGSSGESKTGYPMEYWYPLFPWNDQTRQSMTLGSTYIKTADGVNEYGNTLPVFPAFGYTDCGLVTETNVASNPYTGFEKKLTLGRTDGFDLAWAVDAKGQPVTFENGIHYIKVQSACFIENGAIGEKSTEVNMVRTAKANDSSVGKTADAEKITFDGTDIQLESGKYEYDASVSGAFDVQVKASDNANIYINSIRGNTANFKVAAHGVIRIIIQEGEKEPVIYYFKITDDNKSAENVITAVSLDAAGGQIYDYEKEILYFDKDSSVRELPIPTKDGCTFMGWYGGQQKYTKYEEGMPEEVNLVAKWKENNPKPLDPEKKITVSFRLIGATQSKGDVDLSSEEKNGYKGAEYVTWIPTRSYTLPEGSTVYDLFAKAMKDTGMKEKGGSGGYVSSIWAPSQFGGYELSEFTNGKYSGWMYTMNGDHTDGIKVQKLLNNAEIVFHYVNDYRYEVADWAKMGGEKWPQLGTGKFHNEWLKAPDRIGGTGGGSPVIEETKDVTTSGAAGAASTTAPTEVKVTEKTSADGTKETVAEVKVDAAHHDEIIKQAAENKSAEIVLEVEKTDTKGADSVQLSLDVTFVKNVADKTDADLTVNTENGKVTLDQETIKTVLAETKGATITLEVTKVSKPTEVQKKAAGANGHLLKLTIKSGDKVISDFNKGKVKVVAEIVSKLLDKKVAAIHIADDGKIEQLAGKVLTIGGKKYYEFTTPHFSTFALVDAEELGLEVEEPQVDAKALSAKLTPVARSAKTAKKNVKVTVSLDKQDKAMIKELKDAGYTVKYRFYRSTKKAAGYKAAVTKKTAAYTNTGGKKGTKYYYKVQVRVYDADGKLTAKSALKQCKYASRTWTKGK